MKDKIEFIIDTLETAIEWADYADDYFKKKHGLEQDRENVKKSIDMLHSLEQQNTALQERIKDLEELKTCEGCNAQFNNDCNLGILPKNIYSFEFSCSKYKPKLN